MISSFLKSSLRDAATRAGARSGTPGSRETRTRANSSDSAGRRTSLRLTRNRVNAPHRIRRRRLRTAHKQPPMDGGVQRHRHLSAPMPPASFHSPPSSPFRPHAPRATDTRKSPAPESRDHARGHVVWADSATGPARAYRDVCAINMDVLQGFVTWAARHSAARLLPEIA